MNLVDQYLGQYQITEFIGSGGMASVYKAYQPELDRSVAIKVLLTPSMDTSTLEERFIREAKAIAQLSHPNILPIYDVGIEHGLRYFVMKYVQGQTLRQLLGEPLDLATISHYIDQIAAALDHAHAQGILHRDVKPDNILLEGDWLFLADFGLAKIVNKDELLTHPGGVMGTSAYLSPEQAEGGPLDHRTDIYSLGIVLYEMVTGRMPYQGKTAMEIIFKHIYEPIPSPRQFKPDLPKAVEEIIYKAVAKNPAERYNRAGELAEAIRSQLGSFINIPSKAKKPFPTQSKAASEISSTAPKVKGPLQKRLHRSDDDEAKLREELEAPGGVVKLNDKFYIERDADIHLKREIIKLGTTTTIRAPGQTGKTSLLIRGKHYAEQEGAKAVYLNLQNFGSDRLSSPELFLRELAESIVYELQLSPTDIERAWQGLLGPQKKLTHLIGSYILPRFDTPIILILDEVDCLLQVPFHQDFFGLVRSWHNRRALDEQWSKFNIVMVISTEPHMLIADVNQSPFNVGLKLYLEDFNQAQVYDLNERHGSPVKENEFPQLMELLNGHPYLTRKALYTMVSEGLTWSNLTYIVTSEQGPFGDHLRHQHWLLHNERNLREAMKQIIKHNRCSDEMALFRLLRAGLVKGGGKLYSCRCDLYRIYFQDKLKLSI